MLSCLLCEEDAAKGTVWGVVVVVLVIISIIITCVFFSRPPSIWLYSLKHFYYKRQQMLPLCFLIQDFFISAVSHTIVFSPQLTDC